MDTDEIRTTLVTAAKEIIAKYHVLRGEVRVDAYSDNLLLSGWMGSFTMRDDRCVEFNPAPSIVEMSNPDLLARLVLTGADGEFRRAVVRGGRGDWQIAR